MATINGTTSNNGIKAIIEYTYTQSVDNNTSTITAKLYYVKGSSTQTTYGTWSGSITIGGKTKSFSGVKLSLAPNSGNVLAGTYTETISHNADGSKTITISATGGISGTSMSSTNCSGSVKLNDIPRKATITDAPDFNDEANPVLKYSNKAGNAVVSLQACIASTDGNTTYVSYRDISKTGSSYTFNLTTAERNTLLNAFTSSNSGAVKFYVKTVIGETTYRDSVQVNFSIINANPILAPVVKDTGSVSITLTGDADNKLIKNYNVMSVSANATAQKGATIKSYRIECGGKSINTASGTLSYVTDSKFTFYVMDSRGNTTTQTITKTMIDYKDISCNLEVDTPDTQGNLTFRVKGNYFNGSFGAKTNTLTIQYRIKANNGSYGDWINITPTLSGNTYSKATTLTGLDYKSTYTIQARAYDLIKSVETAEIKKKSTPVFDWGENDFNFNVDALTVTEDSGAVYDLLKFVKAFTSTTDFNTTHKAGANWTINSSSAVLLGNILRVYFNGVRSTPVSGNVANEEVVTISFDMGNKIASAYNTNFSSGSEGAVATYSTEVSRSGNTLSITIKLCATATDLTNSNAYFILPVKLNI